MSVTAVRTPAEYESQLRRYLYDRSEEGRAVRVGEKEVSERAEIVERYRDLFSREQLDALRSEAPVHVPEPLARPRADRDLLLHLRGDHARARVARSLLRALRRRGGAERGGDDVSRGGAVPPLHR